MNITINNSTFKDEASVIRNQYECPKNINFEQIATELHEIKRCLKKGSPEFQAVETLEKGSKTHDWGLITSSISKFVLQFTSATLSNLAGTYLSTLFKLGK